MTVQMIWVTQVMSLLTLISGVVLGCEADPPSEGDLMIADEMEHHPLDEDPPSWEDLRLDAVDLGQERLGLSWSDAVDDSGIGSYLIFQNEELIATVSGEILSLQIGPLEPAQYTFHIRASDRLGNVSEDGPRAEFTVVDGQRPFFDPSASLRAESSTASQVVLEWDAATDQVGVAEYRVFMDDEQVMTTPASVRTAEIDGLIGGVTYRFRVQALDAALHHSRRDLFLTFRHQDGTPPSWTSDAELFVTDVTETSLWLRWSAAIDQVGVTNYRISQDGMEIALSPADRRYVKIEGLSALTEYTFEVLAEDAQGLQTSEPLSVTTQTLDLEPPTWPTESRLDVIQSGPDTVTLSWNEAVDLSAVVDYVVYQNHIEIERLPATARTVVVSELLSSVDYHFRVEATDLAGQQSSLGPQAEFVLSDLTPPEWPEGSIMTASEITPMSARLTWTPATDNDRVLHYRLEVNQDVMYEVEGTLTTTLIDQLVPEERISLALIAVDAAGLQSRGPSVTFTTPNLNQPEWPEGARLLASEVRATSLTLSWPPLPTSPDLYEYVIYQNEVEIAVLPYSIDRHEITGLLPDTEYHFKVEGRGTSGLVSSDGPEVVVSTSDLVSPQWSAQTEIEVTQLTANSLTLGWETILLEELIMRYEVYQDGILLGTCLPSEHTFDVEGLEEGIVYHFVIEAVIEEGVMAEHPPEITLTTLDQTSPTWPDQALITIADLNEDSLRLFWPVADDLIGVVNYRAELDGEVVALLEQSELLLTELTPDTEYSFSVYALDAEANESASLDTTFRTLRRLSPSSQEVYDGMRIHCVACHEMGDSGYFASFDDFQSLVIDNSELIIPGDAEGSVFLKVLVGEGTPPWSSMPLGSMNYQQLVQQGTASLSLDELRRWVIDLGGE